MQHPINGTMSLDDLRLFLLIAELGSFAEAARHSRVPTSTLSRRIGVLESALGARLLQRSSRHVALTPEGERLVARAAEHVGALEAALDGISDREREPSGRIRVTATLLIGAQRIAPALIAYAQRYPRVAVELQLTNTVLPMLEAGIDLAFRAGPISDVDLVARRIASVPFALAASPGLVRQALGGRRRVAPAALSQAPAVLTRATAPWRLRRRDGTVQEVRPAVRFVANDPRVALAAAASGLGVVAAPVDAIVQRGGGLVRLSVVGREVLPRELFAVYPSRLYLPARVRLAIDFVAQHLSAA